MICPFSLTDQQSRYTHSVLALIIGVVVTACSVGPAQTNPDRLLPQPSPVAAPAEGCPTIAEGTRCTSVLHG